MEQGKHTFLVLDDSIVQDRANLRLRLGRVEKSPRNPLFVEEYVSEPPKRWEARYDNLYPNVIYDRQEGLYKLWYNAFIRDGGSERTSLERRRGAAYSAGHREDGLLYAVSVDGLTWTKPDLGLVPFDGATDNNIVMSTDTHGIHGVGVLIDPADPDPARRYKALFRNARDRRMATAFSGDGLHWSEPVSWPEHDAVGDTHNNAFRDPGEWPLRGHHPRLDRPKRRSGGPVCPEDRERRLRALE